MSTLLFVYGTLKRGCANHAYLADQKFVAAARTVPGFRLFDLGGYPAIVASETDRFGVKGEVWEVDAAGLERLDRFEGVHEGLYRRDRVRLEAPFAEVQVDAYFSVLPVVGKPEVGDEWIE